MEHIKLETSDGSVFIYSYDEIAKYAKEKRAAEPLLEPEYHGELQSGRKGMIQLGYRYGSIHNVPFRSFGADLINSYLFNPYFLLGLGLGVRNYTLPGHQVSSTTLSEFNLVPLFSYFEYKIFDSDISPYVSLSSGYLIPITDSGIGGFMLSPKMGFDMYDSHFVLGMEWKKILGVAVRALSIEVGVVF